MNERCENLGLAGERVAGAGAANDLAESDAANPEATRQVTVVRVDSTSLGEFKARLARMNARCRELGFGTIEVVSRTRGFWSVMRHDPATGRQVNAYLVPYRSGEPCEDGVVSIHEYTLAYPAAMLGQWTVIGRLARTGSTTITVDLSGDKSGLAALRPYADRPISCDECGLSRRRVQGFVLRGRQGQIRCVGGECLQALTGEDPQAMLGLLKLREDQGIGQDEYGWRFGINAVPVVEMVAAACMVIKTYGFVSSQVARDRSLVSSASTVASMLRATQDEEYERREFRKRKEHWLAMARDLIAQARRAVEARCDDGGSQVDADEQAAAIHGAGEEVEARDDFMDNVHRILAQEWVEIFRPAVLGVAVAGIRTMLARASQGPKPASPGQWMGEIGQTLQIECRVSFVQPSAYDPNRSMVIVVDDELRAYRFYASTIAHFLEEGTTRRALVRLRVKSHDLWRGTKQTTATHFKFMGWADERNEKAAAA